MHLARNFTIRSFLIPFQFSAICHFLHPLSQLSNSFSYGATTDLVPHRHVFIVCLVVLESEVVGRTIRILVFKISSLPLL